MLSQHQEKNNPSPPTSDIRNPTSDIRLLNSGNDTAKTFLLGQITTPLSKENRVIFWLCRNSGEASSVYENLKFWQKLNKTKTPIKLLNPENPVQLSIINYQLLKNIPSVIISTFENLSHLNPNQPTITVKLNQKLNPQTLAQKLTTTGYDRNKTADQPGTFAIRGEVIQIWTPQLAQPVKIELDFNKVSKLKLGRQNLSETDIIPVTAPKDSNKLTMKQSNNETMIILSDPTDAVLKKFKTNPKIIFNSLSDKSEIKNHKSEIKNPPLYHGNFSNFTTDIKKYQNKNYKIIIATNRQKSLQALFKEKNINSSNYLITQLPNYSISGFISHSPKIFLLTDLEIFGKDKIHPPPKKKRTSHIPHPTSNIQPNDFVVHEDHGIATFRGTSIQEIDKIKKEFFILEYKDKDKLYVPVELADKIDKYIGLANPPIHRLHGSSWHQITKKIKEQAEKVAKELLDLYAQRKISHAPAFAPKTPEEQELESSFPYQETKDQLKTIKDVEQDLEQTKPTDRLICGDVGFGKTEVAIRAAFKAVMNGYQVTLLCPTTILAQQHYDTFINRLKKFPVNTEVLSRFKTKSAQKKVITQAKSGLIDILIGTHRLLSQDIGFKNLGLIIIDEEQRFGVEHKEKLKKLRTNAHILTLTATPIPRTLNFSLSGLRDISTILTPPPDRQKIKTIIKQYEEQDIKKAIQKEIKRKGQVYFVHNQVETINLIAKKLKKLIPNARLGIAHGQLPENQLAQVMSEFDNKKIDVLVCSTIIENGLDLPNVNTIIIDNATRFGLAQLYQLRGRVGRSPRQAFAYFFYRRLNSTKPNVISSPPEGGQTFARRADNLNLTPRELARLNALKQAEELGSGFQLAIRDMEIRGVGNILGKKQHGAVAAIGLSLYTRLLSQSVEELKTGVRPEPIPDITIDLPLESNIPPELEPNEPKRLNLYQHLASITNLNELKNIRNQFAKKHSLNISNPKNIRDGFAKTYSRNISEKVTNLFHLLEIKLLAQQSEISSINTTFGLGVDGTRKKRITIKFKNKIDQIQFQKILSTQPYWKQSQNQIKINLEDLGETWIKKLKQAIKIFKK